MRDLLPLFDLHQSTPMQRAPEVQTGRAVDAADQPDHLLRASSDHAVDAERASSRSVADGVRRAGASEIAPSSDVLRVIVHKAGPFTEVREGKLTGRQFCALELTDGSIVIEYTDDHSRLPAPPTLSSFYISDGLHYGMLKEVRA